MSYIPPANNAVDFELTIYVQPANNDVSFELESGLIISKTFKGMFFFMNKEGDINGYYYR